MAGEKRTTEKESDPTGQTSSGQSANANEKRFAEKEQGQASLASVGRNVTAGEEQGTEWEQGQTGQASARQSAKDAGKPTTGRELWQADPASVSQESTKPLQRSRTYADATDNINPSTQADSTKWTTILKTSYAEEKEHIQTPVTLYPQKATKSPTSDLTAAEADSMATPGMTEPGTSSSHQENRRSTENTPSLNPESFLKSKYMKTALSKFPSQRNGPKVEEAPPVPILPNRFATLDQVKDEGGHLSEDSGKDSSQSMRNIGTQEATTDQDPQNVPQDEAAATGQEEDGPAQAKKKARKKNKKEAKKTKPAVLHPKSLEFDELEADGLVAGSQPAHRDDIPANMSASSSSLGSEKERKSASVPSKTPEQSETMKENITEGKKTGMPKSEEKPLADGQQGLALANVYQPSPDVGSAPTSGHGADNSGSLRPRSRWNNLFGFRAPEPQPRKSVISFDFSLPYESSDKGRPTEVVAAESGAGKAPMSRGSSPNLTAVEHVSPHESVASSRTLGRSQTPPSPVSARNLGVGEEVS